MNSKNHFTQSVFLIRLILIRILFIKNIFLQKIINSVLYEVKYLGTLNKNLILLKKICDAVYSCDFG